MATVFSSGRTAVITGGASGIGLALVRRCLKSEMNVLVVDRHEAKLEGAQTERLQTYKMDVTNVEDWKGLRSKVLKDFNGKVDLLALNAGIGLDTSFQESSISNFRQMMDVNVFGVINGISILLPLVEKSDHSAVIITGSKQGITNPPGNPGYNATKAALKTLAEHLSYDLRSTNVRVHLLIPGWTWTSMTADTTNPSKKHPAQWIPEQVVECLEKKMEEGQFWVICPDNEVTEDMDRKRMLWGVDDIVKGRPPLSRWRQEYEPEVEAWMKS